MLDQGISVVIATCNRLDVLQHCLACIDEQECWRPHEVIVVDDGSQDGTREFLVNACRGGRLRCARHERSRGPAAARNSGVRLARYVRCLIMNDDTIMAPDCLRSFAEYQEAFADERISVIGNIEPWPEGMTAFEYWSAHGGSQFGHALLSPDRYRSVGEEHFVTSNIMVSRELLLRHPFDESFPWARYEDRELGYRLARKAGHVIHYLPAAKSFHRHRLPFGEWLAKWDHFAWAALHFARLYPEDVELAAKLSLRRAEDMTDFEADVLHGMAHTLNTKHSCYFLPGTLTPNPDVRTEIERAFRGLQEFSRLVNLRRHLDLEPPRDRATRIPGNTILQRLIDEIRPEV